MSRPNTASSEAVNITAIQISNDSTAGTTVLMTSLVNETESPSTSLFSTATSTQRATSPSTTASPSTVKSETIPPTTSIVCPEGTKLKNNTCTGKAVCF